MPDDPTKHARDAKRIDISEDYECRYWSKKFNVTPEDLKRLIEKVGPMVKDVERELSK
jgi:hypothetical protein